MTVFKHYVPVEVVLHGSTPSVLLVPFLEVTCIHTPGKERNGFDIIAATFVAGLAAWFMPLLKNHKPLYLPLVWILLQEIFLSDRQHIFYLNCLQTTVYSFTDYYSFRNSQIRVKTVRKVHFRQLQGQYQLIGLPVITYRVVRIERQSSRLTHEVAGNWITSASKLMLISLISSS